MVHPLRVLAPESTPPATPAVERSAPRAVRISLTDRCDMACVYCRPSHADGRLPATDRLDVDSWVRLVAGLKAEGIRRVRITGGEPLLFGDVVQLVRRLATLGLDDLALTTNASQLARLAVPLREAGLARLNISLDSLRPETFWRVTRGGRLSQVLEGIEAACRAGYDEIKTNTVVVRGENDGELPSIVRWTWEHGITPRFLELMGVGEGAKIFRTRGVSYDEMRRALEDLLLPDEARVEPNRGPARYVQSRDGRRRVGFVTGTTQTFCEGCDRLRATSDGVLRSCLARSEGVSVRSAVGASSAAGAIGERLAEAWAAKPDSGWKGCTEPTAAAVSMKATGG
jgi:cyclic pyranopterin phosphate synthase